MRKRSYAAARGKFINMQKDYGIKKCFLLFLITLFIPFPFCLSTQPHTSKAFFSLFLLQNNFFSLIVKRFDYAKQKTFTAHAAFLANSEAQENHPFKISFCCMGYFPE
jgi:hypothetical protein